MPKIFYRPDLENVIKIKEDKWFKDQQLLLLQMVNTDYGKDLLCIPKNYKNIFKFGKNHIFYNPRMEDGVYKYDWDFRVGSKWANVIRSRWEEFQGAALWFQSQNSMRPVVLMGNRHYVFGGPYFPDADIETTSFDGTNTSGNQVSWTLARDATTGTANDTGASGFAPKSTETAGALFNVTRGFLLFDTSAIPDTDTISAATFSVAASGSGVSNADSTSYKIVSSTPAANTSLTADDFDNVGAVIFATMDFSAWVDTDTTYNDFVLDANGIANISKTEVSKFGTRTGLDTGNTAPASAGNANQVAHYFADQAGTTSDPKLTGTSAAATAKATGAALLLGVGA